MVVLKSVVPVWLSMASILLGLSLAGCGGDGGANTGPDDPFPDVAGVYNVHGGFDGLTNDEATFVGSLVLTQASRQTGELTGTMSVTATINGQVITAGNVQILSASVSPSGTVSFQLGRLSTGGSWTFSGTSAGETITGRHTLTDGSSSFSGDWTATTGSIGSGSLTVTVLASGSNLDPDGYTLVIDGASRGPIGVNPVTISGLAPGNHSVGLTGVAANCEVQNENPRLVAVSEGATASTSFNVVCTVPLPSTGSIQVTTTTSGSDPDPDGYTATLDGTGPATPLAANGSATFSNVPTGSHNVVLSGIAGNCAADAASKSVTVTSGATATVAFTITCNAIPPSTGSIRVSTTTSGPDPDPDGYDFAVDGGSTRAIGVTADETVNNVAAGSHTVVLSDVAGNCSVGGGASKSVTVTGGQTANVAFSITCTAIPPSASRSTMLADPKSIPAGTGSSTITVTVKGAAGELLAGIAVSLSSTGSGNTITPQSSTTDENGEATFSFSSTVFGDKTITAVAGGVTLNDTEVITVFPRGSATEITSITPEPSAPGEDFTVTVKVTGEGGGVPTGTVAVFSLQETGGCNAAPLDNQGIATCTFALNQVGTQMIQAAYSGDDEFEDSSDPEGQAHEVAEPPTSARRPLR
jgi:hypothetical protein